MTKWKLREGYGRHRPNREGMPKVVNPGDVIECSEEELGSAVDKFQRLRQVRGTVTDDDTEEENSSVGAKVVSVGGGWYNVVKNGRRLNERALKKEEAEEFIRGGQSRRGDDTEDSRTVTEAATPKD